MYRDYFIHEQLEALRRDARKSEPVALELPVPMPYWPEDQRERGEGGDDGERESNRGVVIIDMNDYSDFEV
jgi:hypothetical protein